MGVFGDFAPTVNAVIRINETIKDAAGNSLGSKGVFADPADIPNSGNPDHVDSANFAPQSIVFVEKNIEILGPGVNDGAFLTMFEQRFSQVPEPATSTLILCAFVVGLLSLRRRTN